MIQQFIDRMPKIDLHCHLDGSLSPATIRVLAERVGIDLPDDPKDLTAMLTAPEDCSSLVEYLTRFELPVACLQTAENFYTAALDLASDAARENVIYIEVRFAPLLSAHERLPADVVVRSVIEGLEEGKRRFGVKYGLILCAMRHHPHEMNEQLLPLAEKYLGSGVVALDLAGDEKGYPACKHHQLFADALKRGIPYTIHAGEADGPGSIWSALDLGARRIGHGISAKDDPELMKHCAAKGIGFELCPVSNLQTKAARDWDDYPFRLFLDEGMTVTVNTDNRTVSNTNLTREFTELDARYGLTTAEIERLVRTSAAVSFADDQLKQELNKAFDMFLAEYQSAEN